MDRRVAQPKGVTTSPVWGTPPPCKQALRLITFVMLCHQVKASLQPLWITFLLDLHNSSHHTQPHQIILLFNTSFWTPLKGK